MVTIRAMGQTFVVRNHLPRPTVSQPARQQPTPPPTIQPISPIVAMATANEPADNTSEPCGRLSDDDDDELASTVCEDPSPPESDPPSSSISPPIITTTEASITTCADQSDDYQDFLSKFGILSLPLHPSLDRQSVAQIDSPDDTLVSGSLSPLLDQLDPLLTPDVPPSIGGKCCPPSYHVISAEPRSAQHPAASISLQPISQKLMPLPTCIFYTPFCFGLRRPVFTHTHCYRAIAT